MIIIMSLNYLLNKILALAQCPLICIHQRELCTSLMQLFMQGDIQDYGKKSSRKNENTGDGYYLGLKAG